MGLAMADGLKNADGGKKKKVKIEKIENIEPVDIDVNDGEEVVVEVDAEMKSKKDTNRKTGKVAGGTPAATAKQRTPDPMQTSQAIEAAKALI